MTLETFTQERLREFVEVGAALEHERWSRWHLHMLDKQTTENLARWERQAATPYAQLSEREKESDRREVREYLQFLSKAITDAYLLGLERAQEIVLESCTVNEHFGIGVREENARYQAVVEIISSKEDTLQKEKERVTNDKT